MNRFYNLIKKNLHVIHFAYNNWIFRQHLWLFCGQSTYINHGYFYFIQVCTVYIVVQWSKRKTLYQTRCTLISSWTWDHKNKEFSLRQARYVQRDVNTAVCCYHYRIYGEWNDKGTNMFSSHAPLSAHCPQPHIAFSSRSPRFPGKRWLLVAQNFHRCPLFDPSIIQSTCILILRRTCV